jgi:hypothetical protein
MIGTAAALDEYFVLESQSLESIVSAATKGRGAEVIFDTVGGPLLELTDSRALPTGPRSTSGRARPRGPLSHHRLPHGHHDRRGGRGRRACRHLVGPPPLYGDAARLRCLPGGGGRAARLRHGGPDRKLVATVAGLGQRVADPGDRSAQRSLRRSLRPDGWAPGCTQHVPRYCCRHGRKPPGPALAD